MLRRTLRLVVMVGSGIVGALAASVAGVAGGAATGGEVPWFPTMEQHPLWWLAGSTIAVAASGSFGWWAQRWYERVLVDSVPVALRPESWMVDRPAELTEIVQALRGSGGATVGITTAVHGAGGFGKTTVARLVRSDRRVLRRFGSRVYWVTLGRDVRRGALTERVNDLVRRIDPERAQPFTDLRQAAEHLAAVLADGPRRLLILDDVWFDDQLAAFPVAGRAARLVTTRSPSLVPGQAVSVRVDQMSRTQARQVLVAGLVPEPSSSVLEGLLVETGRWPLLLRLINKIMVDQTRSHTDVDEVARELLQRLRRDGALQVDQLTGATTRQLDVNDPDQRDKAVATTIEASTGLLSAAEYARFAELAIFVEDETVPISLVAAGWRATSGLDETESRALCARLADLALLTLSTDDDGTIGLHDVIRDYLADRLGPAEVARLHRRLLDGVAADLPRVPAVSGQGTVVAWWELPHSARYLREHLVEHLLATGRRDHAEVLATDLRWVQSRLEESGPLAPFADLTFVDTPRAERLCRLLGQVTHLLTVPDPAHSQTDIFYARVAHDPEWGPQARSLAALRTLPALATAWTLPDLPDPGLRRTLTGHTGAVRSLAVAPDGSWLTIGSDDGLWTWDDPATGRLRASLSGRPGSVGRVAVASDGNCLAIADDDGTVRSWDPATGRAQTRVSGRGTPVDVMAVSSDGNCLATATVGGRVRIHRHHHRTTSIYDVGVRVMALAPDGSWLALAHYRKFAIWDLAGTRPREVSAEDFDMVRVMAVAPDGSWLATGAEFGTVQIWDPATGRRSAALIGHTHTVRLMTVAPDGSWLAAASDDGVWIWDLATGRQRARLAGRDLDVRVMAVAPDGTWCATAGGDMAVHLWDMTTGLRRATLAGHDGEVTALAVAPDGTWLASAGDDGTVRVWDPTAGRRPGTLTGHDLAVSALAMGPDGSWLVTAGYDRRVRIWDTSTGLRLATLTGDDGEVKALAVAPDGTWLVIGGDTGTTQVWHPTGDHRATPTGHPDPVSAVAVAPDGTWFATGGTDGSVRIWERSTGRPHARLTGHDAEVTAATIGPDGSWLATTGYDGTVRIWARHSGHERAVLTGHSGPVAAVAVAPDGSWLATGGHDNAVRIWDTVTGHERAVLRGHSGPVAAVAVAPDGSWLATGGHDNAVRIWDISTGFCVAVMRTERSVVTCCWGIGVGYRIFAGGTAGLYCFEFDPAHPAGQPTSDPVLVG
ncbi:NB-ARC domain-containing protein [Polymorphospora sp. NPDC050346]|uniref:NB-ARC domain-containing protein n=1 Tax=Polymorphospora sp. NPDC050346 TaxID=3155780 RepID=UPI0033C0E508